MKLRPTWKLIALQMLRIEERRQFLPPMGQYLYLPVDHILPHTHTTHLSREEAKRTLNTLVS